jgi:D-amino peptidase
MRVVLWMDMEGAAQVVDHRECWPAFPQYWQSGRRAITDETAAAARGLLDGGASEVLVVNGHGLGWPNLIWDDLPEGVRPADDNAWNEGFDAMFQIGFHARAGTPDAFMAHTMVPGLAVNIDGASVTESHIWARLVGVPVLGVAGDAALADQLDGILQGTPFLPVKHADSRGRASPVNPDRERSLEAVREFAARCAEAGPRPLDLAGQVDVTMVLDPELATAAEGRAGLVTRAPGVLGRMAEDGACDAQPALEAAINAALQPLLTAQGDLDLSSEDAMLRADPPGLERCRRFFVEWSEADPVPAS